MKIFCLIPAYNEKGNLTELTERLVSTLSEQKIRFTVFFVIQGEKDTLCILDNLKRTYPQINYLYFPRALGIGKAYKIGFEQIDKSITHVLTLDADLNHDPKELPKFFRSWKKDNADIIIGSRFIKDGRFNDKRIWKRLASYGVNLIITNLSGIKVHDITSGYRLIKREVIDKIKDDLKELRYTSYMEFILLAHKHGFKIREVAIIYKPRVWGKSKMKKVKTFFDYLFFFCKNLIS